MSVKKNARNARIAKREPGGTIMPVVLDRYTRSLSRHENDHILGAGND
jgi:hypothetical protein